MQNPVHRASQFEDHLHNELHLQGFNRCLTPLAGHHKRRVEHLHNKLHLQGFNRYLTDTVGGNLILKHSRSVNHLHNERHLQGFNRCLTPPAGHHNRRFEHLHSKPHLQGFDRYLTDPVGGNLTRHHSRSVDDLPAWWLQKELFKMGRHFCDVANTHFSGVTCKTQCTGLRSSKITFTMNCTCRASIVV